MAQKISAFYGKVVAPRLAQLFRDCLREVLGVQAPVIRLPSGAVVAATPADPGAAPRKVTGRLWGNIVVRGNKVYINMPYGAYLEADHHKFIERAKKLMQQKTRSSNARIKA